MEVSFEKMQQLERNSRLLKDLQELLKPEIDFNKIDEYTDNLFLLQAMARNSSTPSRVLYRLIQHPDPSIKLALLDNISLPKNFLKTLAGSNERSIRLKVLRYPKVTSKILELYMNEPDIDIVREVLLHTAITPELIEEIYYRWEGEDKYLEMLVVTHPRTSKNLLDYIINHSNNDKIKQTAKLELEEKISKEQKECKDQLQCKLEEESRIEQLEEILHDFNNVAHPGVFSSELKKYLKSDLILLVCATARNSNLPKEDLEDLLFNNRSGIIRASALDNIKITKEMLKKVAFDRDIYVRCTALRHPKTDGEVLESFKEDVENYVVIKIINHPKVTPELLDYFGWSWLTADSQVIVEVIKNQKTTNETLEYIIENVEDDVKGNHLRTLAKQELEKRNHNNLTW